jgi:hypothetical protein
MTKEMHKAIINHSTMVFGREVEYHTGIAAGEALPFKELFIERIDNFSLLH